jgi:hypothetical protein
MRALNSRLKHLVCRARSSGLVPFSRRQDQASTTMHVIERPDPPAADYNVFADSRFARGFRFPSRIHPMTSLSTNLSRRLFL